MVLFLSAPYSYFFTLWTKKQQKSKLHNRDQRDNPILQIQNENS